jgi:TolB-like protein/lipoprotein NlpI
MFCLDDGAELLYGPAPEEPATAILNTGGSPSEAATRAQVRTTAEARPADKTTTPRSSVSLPRATKPLSIALAAGIVVLGIFFAYRYLGSVGSTAGQINSIAVLPFENRSGNAETDYLSDGLTDSLVFRFSQLPNIKVSPTSSVIQYKGKPIDVAQIAKDLGVDAVLSGRVLQLGDNLTISVELVDARTKSLVWKEQYDRKMADLLATQREIATTLTQKMQLKLAGDERGITKKYTSSNEAYQLYMKGRYHWSRRTKDDLLKAIDNYKEAIALDPNFALAYAATAEVYNSMGKNPDAPPKDCIPLAKQAATHALEIDPMLPQAHSALADSLALYDWDWVESERHFKKALELDPNISYTYVAYGGSYLSPIGKPDDAVEAMERAVSLEPLSMIDNCLLTTAYINDRKYDKALTQGRSTYDLDPTFPFAAHWLGFALIVNGKYDEAIALGQRVSPDSPFAWLSKVVGGVAFAKQGKRAEAEEQIRLLRELSKTRYIRPYYLASIYATLGDKDKAFAELERSFTERDCYLGRLTVDPFMDPLRDDPRFKELRKRMGLQ